VSAEDLATLFEAARWAPSTYNEQEWRFLYAHRDGPHWATFFDCGKRQYKVDVRLRTLCRPVRRNRPLKNLSTLSTPGLLESFDAVEVQADGKLVVCGCVDYVSPEVKFAVVRYPPDGTIDGSFGDGGLVAVDLPMTPSSTKFWMEERGMGGWERSFGLPG
jgi:hypothetical protein